MTRGAQQSIVRTINDKLVCRYLIDTPGISRVDIAGRLHVSVPAVLKMIDRLRFVGLVTDVGEESLQRPGPRAMLFGINPDYAIVTSIHVRHDELRVNHRAFDGTVVAEEIVPFDDSGDIAAQIVDASTSPQPDITQSLTVALPGAIDTATGDVLVAQELPFWKAGTAEQIRRTAPASCVTFDREINLRAEAEHHLGVAKDVHDFLLVSYGSGIGAALYLDGTLRSGAHGAAGEVGYAPAQTTPDLKPYQDVAGAWQLAPSLGYNHDPEFTWLQKLVAAGDDEVWDAIAAAISPGLLAMATLLDPQLVILSGEMARIAGYPLLEAVNRWLATNALITPPPVALSTLGDQAVLDGAWVRGWNALVDAATDPNKPS